MTKSKLMMSIFVASESFFFLALIISYIYFSRPGGSLSETAKYLDIPRTSIFTFFLLSSSITIEKANHLLQKGKRQAMLTWLSVSVGFGLVFLIGQGLEYAALISEHVTISQNVFGSAFFTLTGFHGFHVFLGLLALAILGSLIYTRKFLSVEYDAFNTATVYWHFVDAVWVVVFSVVYIGSII